MNNNPFDSLNQLNNIGEQFKQMFGDDFMRNLMPQMGMKGMPEAPGIQNGAEGASANPMGWMPWNQSASHPKVDLLQTKQEVIVLVEVPGMEKASDVKLSVEAVRLTLRGSYSNRYNGVAKEQFALSERQRGTFEREIQLPVRIRTDKVRALYRYGILEIHMVKDTERDDRLTGKQVDIDFL